jgi:1,4-alpha-glucan branching enzyme
MLNREELIFMGGELAQWREWDHDQSLEWHLLAYSPHQGVQKWLGDLNRVYRTEKALFEKDFDVSGFSWIDVTDVEHSTISLMRKGRMPDEVVLAVFNFTPVPLFNYPALGAPFKGAWKEILNSDAKEYGGEGYGNQGKVVTESKPFHGQPFTLI